MRIVLKRMKPFLLVLLCVAIVWHAAAVIENICRSDNRSFQQLPESLGGVSANELLKTLHADAAVQDALSSLQHENHSLDEEAWSALLSQSEIHASARAGASLALLELSDEEFLWLLNESASSRKKGNGLTKIAETHWHHMTLLANAYCAGTLEDESIDVPRAMRRAAMIQGMLRERPVFGGATISLAEEFLETEVTIHSLLRIRRFVVSDFVPGWDLELETLSAWIRTNPRASFYVSCDILHGSNVYHASEALPNEVVATISTDWRQIRSAATPLHMYGINVHYRDGLDFPYLYTDTQRVARDIVAMEATNTDEQPFTVDDLLCWLGSEEETAVTNISRYASAYAAYTDTGGGR